VPTRLSRHLANRGACGIHSTQFELRKKNAHPSACTGIGPWLCSYHVESNGLTFVDPRGRSPRWTSSSNRFGGVGEFSPNAVKSQRSISADRPPGMPAARPSEQVLADRRLVEQCLAGEQRAWTLLYRHCHDGLLGSIRAFLGRNASDASLVDEIAARVWYALIRSDFELLARFDVSRGCRLSTFLSVLAKTEARLLLRSERRRRVREYAVSRRESGRNIREDSAETIAEEEFVATLSPAERSFYDDVLKASFADSCSVNYSPQNTWQLRHRVRKKLERFITDA
jgi:hypothetical protein